MIPDMVDIGSTWEVLPSGIHDATLSEVEHRFVANDRRRALYEGLVRGCQALKDAGCAAIYLDGSFVTAKQRPNDFDVCWEPTGVDIGRLDPVLLDFDDKRKNQRRKYGGEFFPSSVRADTSLTFVEYFQVDRETGKRKGIVRIRL